MECKMSLVRALDMAALSAKCSALRVVYNGVHTPGASHSKCENFSRCTPQQVHARSAHSSDVSHLLRASQFLPSLTSCGFYAELFLKCCLLSMVYWRAAVFTELFEDSTTENRSTSCAVYHKITSTQQMQDLFSPSQNSDFHSSCKSDKSNVMCMAYSLTSGSYR